MGYVALDRTRDTVQELFAHRVQTLTDMSDLRTTLGDLRRIEKDIIINFNNSVEVSTLREDAGRPRWPRCARAWTPCGRCRQPMRSLSA